MVLHRRSIRLISSRREALSGFRATVLLFLFPYRSCRGAEIIRRRTIRRELYQPPFPFINVPMEDYKNTSVPFGETFFRQISRSRLVRNSRVIPRATYRANVGPRIRGLTTAIHLSDSTRKSRTKLRGIVSFYRLHLISRIQNNAGILSSVFIYDHGNIR